MKAIVEEVEVEVEVVVPRLETAGASS